MGVRVLADAAGTRAVEDGRPDGQHHAAGPMTVIPAVRTERARPIITGAVKWYVRGTRKLIGYREAVRLDPGNADYRYALADRPRDAGKATEAGAQNTDIAFTDTSGTLWVKSGLNGTWHDEIGSVSQFVL